MKFDDEGSAVQRNSEEQLDRTQGAAKAITVRCFISSIKRTRTNVDLILCSPSSILGCPGRIWRGSRVLRKVRLCVVLVVLDHRLSSVLALYIVPIILKGVQCWEDALMAVEAGVQGIVLSNHGGRQLEVRSLLQSLLFALKTLTRLLASSPDPG